MSVRIRFLALIFLSFSQFSQADQYFNELRWDEYLPDDCHELSIHNFTDIGEWPVYGIRGYTNNGFDYEYPISRSDATWLWEAFKNGNEPNSWPSHLGREVDLIKTHKDAMDFDFSVEGEVLEILALIDLQEQFNPRDYFFTGGLEYRDGPGAPTMGELDVLVGERSTCNIVVVGEAKLGKGSLSKAHKQLGRFRGFLNRRNIPASWDAFRLVSVF